MSDSAAILSTYLNKASIANLYGCGHNKELEGFIQDYFDENSDDDDENIELDDGYVEEPVPMPMDLTDATAFEPPLSSTRDEDREENVDMGPFVTVRANDHHNGTSAEVVPDTEDEKRAKEEKKCAEFRCKCQTRLANGDRGCSQQFTTEERLNFRMGMVEMGEGAEEKKDIFLFGFLCGIQVNAGETTCTKKQKQTERQKIKIPQYKFMNRIICRDMLVFMLGISKNKLYRVLSHFVNEGPSIREKSAGGRRKDQKEGHPFSPDDVQRVSNFLTSLVEDHGILLPGRIPGYKRDDIRLLPSSFTKAKVFELYTKAMKTSEFRSMGRTQFFKTWKEFHPDVVVCKPMSDLCSQCVEFNRQLQRTQTTCEAAALGALEGQKVHLQEVEKERGFYKDLVTMSKETLAAEGLRLGRNAPNSRDMTVHYSFDYAQQVHYPSSPLQVGPLYFLVQRKCGIFGICCDGGPQQVNYLIDEGMCRGKGSNTVISLLHHFFETYGHGEKHLTLHCDNCAGQNKNKFVLFYLAWRVMTGLHDTIKLNFMLPGHTKFAPDWCFGLLKRKFRRAEVNCLNDLVEVVEESTNGVNKAQLVGTETGREIVPIYDWQEFFRNFRGLPGIKNQQHFEFCSDKPWIVSHCRDLAEMRTDYLLLNKRTPPTGMPRQIPAPGLSRERQTYLFEKIRQYVAPEHQDTVCPRPAP